MNTIATSFVESLLRARVTLVYHLNRARNIPFEVFSASPAHPGRSPRVPFFQSCVQEASIYLFKLDHVEEIG